MSDIKVSQLSQYSNILSNLYLLASNEGVSPKTSVKVPITDMPIVSSSYSLNGYGTQGIYRMTGTYDAQTFVGWPTGISGYISAYLFVNVNTDKVGQMLVVMNATSNATNMEIYTRTRYEDGTQYAWTDWEKIAKNSQITSLQTSVNTLTSNLTAESSTARAAETALDKVAFYTTFDLKDYSTTSDNNKNALNTWFNTTISAGKIPVAKYNGCMVCLFQNSNATEIYFYGDNKQMTIVKGNISISEDTFVTTSSNYYITNLVNNLVYYYTKTEIDGMVSAINASLATKESSSNKETSIGENADNTHYPSSKAVKDVTDTKGTKVTQVSSNLTTDTLTAFVLKSFGTVSSLTLTLNAYSGNEVPEYMFMFTSSATGTTLTLPSSIKWIGSNEIEPNMNYEVSIMNNVAVMGGYENE